MYSIVRHAFVATHHQSQTVWDQLLHTPKNTERKPFKSKSNVFLTQRNYSLKKEWEYCSKNMECIWPSISSWPGKIHSFYCFNLITWKKCKQTSEIIKLWKEKETTFRFSELSPETLHTHWRESQVKRLCVWFIGISEFEYLFACLLYYTVFKIEL